MPFLTLKAITLALSGIVTVRLLLADIATLDPINQLTYFVISHFHPPRTSLSIPYVSWQRILLIITVPSHVSVLTGNRSVAQPFNARRSLKPTPNLPGILDTFHRNALHTALPPVPCLVQDDEPSHQPLIFIHCREPRREVSLFTEAIIAPFSVVDNLPEQATPRTLNHPTRVGWSASITRRRRLERQLRPPSRRCYL